MIHTRCVSLRGDGSDQTWRHRSFGLVCTLDSKDAQFLDEVAPQDGDIVLNKTGSSVFNSTNAEHLLRNMGITTLVVSGIFTNSCVEGTTRDAGDLDFRVLLAEDACAAMSASRPQERARLPRRELLPREVDRGDPGAARRAGRGCHPLGTVRRKAHQGQRELPGARSSGPPS